MKVIDLFAGPGGLSEGFSSLFDENGERLFNVCLSIEKEKHASNTLRLRSFLRQFPANNLPVDYYQFLRREISIQQLYNNHPQEFLNANNEVIQHELGKDDPDELNRYILNALEDERNWVVIGGPPCQAYSLVGRSRVGGVNPDDNRVYLYREYLRIIAEYKPSVFVMENVKGILSAKIDNNYIFDDILQDMTRPAEALNMANPDDFHYKIYSFVHPTSFDAQGLPLIENKNFVIKSERYGIPQKRHRVILLGIRNDINVIPNLLVSNDKIPVGDLLDGLPRVRSTVSRIKDNFYNWLKAIQNTIGQQTYIDQIHGLDLTVDKDEVIEEMYQLIDAIEQEELMPGSEFITENANISWKREWFLDNNINGTCNHEAKSHMASDLARYFFLSVLDSNFNRKVRLNSFPKYLLPNHKNVQNRKKIEAFVNRFNVQSRNEPATTITSHLHKDGHYFIHYDMTQCRSLTVREAARIQTFPDNYFFTGSRTDQYIQVGNAVPPLLARQIAEIVVDILRRANIQLH